ncbi:10447_t:CDS:2 [Paraglomus occultum]|uniref:10447_t:CDS:1 n=1 Tax=Paraglomus occultum TaxID=144539 RepID=A0A9N9CYS4_9GLOM|nr:10447_t:CDS:2 [Paraglomus occultum]
MDSTLRVLHNALILTLNTLILVIGDISNKRNLDKYAAIAMLVLTTKLMNGHPGIQNMAAVLLSGYFGYRCVTSEALISHPVTSKRRR